MTDLLIIGTGGAGLTAALTAHEAGLSVTVVTKSLPTQAQTCMAQGGINAALGNVTEDSIQSHIEDTLRAAHGLADSQMIARMCHEAPQSIAWLERMGVPFSRLDHAANPLQSVAQRRLGGASSKRACYAQDYTGLKILHTLYDRCIEAGIDFVTEHYLINLIVNPDTKQVSGATFWDIHQGEVIALEAAHTLIATGGFGALYHDHTTNSYGSTGDGIAAVLRAGGVVSNMEFVQFHPTALQGSAILISESARGEGGYLIDHYGKRFTDELAPRDEVAKAIFRQMQVGHHVHLDIRHLGKEKIEAHLPHELHLCRLHAGIDPIEAPIPIIPVAHYTMGGIATDSTFKVQGLQRCYAIGECANAKVHGANRLGGNSLLEIIAFGRLVIDTIAVQTKLPSSNSLKTQQINHDTAVIEKIFAKPNEVNFYHKHKVLGKLMYRDAGIIRHKDTMHEAELCLDEITAKLDSMGIGDKSKTHNQNLIAFLEFRNALLLAQGVLKSAILRQESRGVHYREDFSLERSDLQAETLCRLSDGKLVLGIGGFDR